MENLSNQKKQNDLIRAKVPDRYGYIINPELSPYDMYKRAKQRHLAEIEMQQKKRTNAGNNKMVEPYAEQLAAQIKKAVEDILNNKKV